MVRIGIVEDEAASAAVIADYLGRYAEESGKEIHCRFFDRADVFLGAFRSDFDIIFMDIEMPGLSGMDAAGKLREIDQNVILVFVTNIQQFAIKGYAVSALDYILKPINYFALSSFMDKAIRILGGREPKELMIKCVDGLRRVLLSQIYYIEVRRHKLIYYTADGDLESWGSLNELEKTYPADFCRCHVGYLVNMQHLLRIEGDDAIVGRSRLKISRSRKRCFLASFAKYLGGR